MLIPLPRQYNMNLVDVNILRQQQDIDLICDTFDAILAAKDAEIKGLRKSKEISSKEGRKAEQRKKTPYFTQMQIPVIRELNFSDAEKALLLILAPRLSLKTGFVVEANERPLNQQDIHALTGWKSQRYVRQVLKTLIMKNVVIEDADGKCRRYQLNPQYFNKGKCSKGAEFTKLFNATLKNLVLDTDAAALLFTAALNLEYRTNYICIEGKRANRKSLTKLLGWRWGERTKLTIEKLIEKRVIYTIKAGREFNYIVDARFCHKGESISDWLENPEIKKITLSQSRCNIV